MPAKKNTAAMEKRLDSLNIGTLYRRGVKERLTMIFGFGNGNWIMYPTNHVVYVVQFSRDLFAW